MFSFFFLQIFGQIDGIFHVNDISPIIIFFLSRMICPLRRKRTSFPLSQHFIEITVLFHIFAFHFEGQCKTGLIAWSLESEEDALQIFAFLLLQHSANYRRKNWNFLFGLTVTVRTEGKHIIFFSVYTYHLSQSSQ